VIFTSSDILLIPVSSECVSIPPQLVCKLIVTMWHPANISSRTGTLQLRALMKFIFLSKSCILGKKRAQKFYLS